ncbi:TPA: hypothetical protein ACPHXD_006506 [Pseudomonas aeruginosa]|uniref:hypothetical protein n=1 Tax=Pseudomonas aeruginosa TaxID=287 RepID=UPI001A2EA6FC|nr:hypothetical protein [Pseudomonas aeruginosa]MBI7821482.1 hypothetical protein [Pseudomonas aeruginosa]UGR49300.1 hypothetical protein LSP16_22985 [Pseudomonas aeruginosa]HCF2932585.1 hypothetical protein [Pseudomonas aeruginosa]HEJ4396772.1 hypothetical protein [Pseudomonas aeruginosa]HEK1335158.1 hypothetical protein [Pseudomonas aeruginosa]
MTTYATGNPLGSKDPRDLYDNAENFDGAMNDRVNTTWNDRFGVSRPTMKGYEEQFNDWLDAQGFEPGVLEYVDGSPLTVDRPTQLIQRGGNLYSVKRPASFPVNLTGNWATDQNLLVAQVDQSLRQQLAEPGGMQMIGALDGKVGDYLPNRIHVRKFGVVGDGVTDDSNALEAAIMAGVPIDFGNLHIRITRSIGNQATIPSSIDWKASGAKIFMDSSTIKESVLYFSVLPLDHRIEGPLFIDGASKAFAGIYLRNNSTDFYPLGYGTMFASDLRVENIRRADATYANGDGILIRGGFTSVTLIRPIVRNVILAPGAGTPGMVGVSGIAVFGNSDGIGYPRTVTIVDPYIENVSSEDPSYLDDMDGIRVFGPHAVTPGVNAIDSTFTITRGVFRNCSGRSIKSQMTTGQVIGGKFIRTTGPASGIGNEEIAFQQGGGYVEDIVCVYYGGNVPSTVINGGEGTVERRRPSLKVKGVYVANHSSPAIPQIVQTFSPGVNTGLISVEDVEVQGPVDRLVEYLVNGDLNALKVANVTVDGLTTELIRAKSSGSSTPFGGKVYAENCINNGTLRPMLTHRVAGNAVVVELSEYGCVGFTRNGSADTSLVNPGSVMRPYAIAGAGQSVGGSMRVQSVNIEPGNVGQIQGHGVNNGVCFAIISINRNSSSNGAVSISSTGVVALAVGSDITVGGTSEPASGLFRVWSQASGGGTINIRNGDTSTRAVTLFSFG